MTGSPAPRRQFLLLCSSPGTKELPKEAAGDKAEKRSVLSVDFLSGVVSGG